MSYTYTTVYQFHTIIIFYNNVRIAARRRLKTGLKINTLLALRLISTHTCCVPVRLLLVPSTALIHDLENITYLPELEQCFATVSAPND